MCALRWRPCPHLSLLLLAGAFLASCGGETEVPLFSKAKAEEVARSFRESWVQGDIDALVAMARVPFTFRSLRWNTLEALRANLPLRVAEFRREMEQAEVFEVFSQRDLIAGRWPRQENVAPETRERRVRELGVEADGFLVRGFREPGRGWHLVLNPELGERLVVVGLPLF